MSGLFCSQSLVSGATQSVNNSPAVAANIDLINSVLLAQQLPPLSKFSGESGDGQLMDNLGMDTFQDWLEQFELVAGAINWSSQAMLVNLITRLQGQAYSFF